MAHAPPQPVKNSQKKMAAQHGSCFLPPPLAEVSGSATGTHSNVTIIVTAFILKCILKVSIITNISFYLTLQTFKGEGEMEYHFP